MPTRIDIENTIKSLLSRYNAEYALLFGSYARGEETPDSDIDVVVFGGKDFKKSVTIQNKKNIKPEQILLRLYIEYCIDIIKLCPFKV